MAQIGRVLKEGQWTPKYSPTHPMVQWDRMDSGIWGPQMGQWTSMYSPNCPMVQLGWERQLWSLCLVPTSSRCYWIQRETAFLATDYCAHEISDYSPT